MAVTRRRLGVALLVEGRTGTEIDGLRRALGCASLRTQSPHVTLVPPVNVREDALGAALAVLRRAAAVVPEPIACALGPVATFAPDAPVLYLAVSEPEGHGGPQPAATLAHLRELHARVNAEPLLRKVDRPFVPHATVLADAEPALIPAALRLHASYRAEYRFDRVFLLEQGPDRVWRRLADVPFGAAIVRGRGGIELTLRSCRLVSPDVQQALGLAPRVAPGDPWLDEQQSSGVLALEARIADAPVAVATLVTAGDLWTLEGMVVANGYRRQGIGARLLSEVVAAAAAAPAEGIRLAEPVAALEPWQCEWLAAHGWRTDARLYPGHLVRCV